MNCRVIQTTLSVLLALGVIAPASVMAQEAVPLQVDLDHAAFAYDADASLLEVYLAFGATTLPYMHDSTQGYRSELPVDLAVRRSTEMLEGTPEEPVWTDSLILSFAVPDTSGLVEGQYFVHQVRAAVPPGEYELHVQIPAQGSRQSLELQRDVLIPDFSDARLVGLSDITLANAIGQGTDREDPFFKNGLIVRPNPNQLYGQALNLLYYYAEAYNTTAIAGDDGHYTLLAYVAEANRPQPLPGLQDRSERPAQSPDVLVGAFDIAALPSGSYFLRLALLNEDNEAEVEQARKFFVFNPGVQREAPVSLEVSFETSQYATMSEEEVERSFKHIDVIANERERRRMRSIEDLNEQRRFLMEFWQARDPNPSTVVNEYRDEFYQRLQYANQRYSNSFRDGWEADRGRVLIKYGSPSQIEPHLYDRDAEPHEIWRYNNIPGEGQAMFIFADRNGYGDFELLHSTVAGERKTPDWQQSIRR